MGANRYMVDGGGATRHIKRRYVIDSSGVARLITKRYDVDASGVTRLTYLFADQFNGVAGLGSATESGIGYFGQGGFGTINIDPFVLNDGKILRAIFNHAGLNGSTLYVSGFSADPGVSWLKFININGLVKLPTESGLTYTFGNLFNWGGTAQWVWATAFSPPQGLSGNSPYSGQISHN